MKLPIIVACALLNGCVASRMTIPSSWTGDAYSRPSLDRFALHERHGYSPSSPYLNVPPEVLGGDPSVWHVAAIPASSNSVQRSSGG